MVLGIEFLLTGIALGLAEGLSPGPLIALIFSETLKNGKKEGVKVAISPLITDSLIILFALVILSSIAANRIIIGIISFFGACFLIYLGLRNLNLKIKESENRLTKNNALVQGVITNLLNPNTYIFWLSIGGPIVFESAHIHISATLLFILGFYITLVGSKITVAIVVDKSKTLVKSKYYAYIIRALGIVLIVFALIFMIDGFELIGLL